MNQNQKPYSYRYQHILDLSILGIILGFVIFYTSQGELGIYQIIHTIGLVLGYVLILTKFQQKREIQLKEYVKSLQETIPLVLLLLTVGAFVAMLIMSGAIPKMMHMMIQNIQPQWFYVQAYVLCSILSLFIGTSWGTIATFGIPLIALSYVLGASVGITASAIVGGAFFGDKMSVVSDTTILASSVSQVRIERHILGMLWTTLPVFILSALFYTLVGYYSIDAMSDHLQFSQETSLALEKYFSLKSVALLPFLFVIIFKLFRLNIILSLLMTIVFINVPLIILVEHVDFSHLWNTLWEGYSISNVLQAEPQDASILQILNRGGMKGMFPASFLVILVYFFIHAIKEYGLMDRLIARFIKENDSNQTTLAKSYFATVATNIVISNTYFVILFVGRLFEPIYKKKNIPSTHLSRILEDGATMVSSTIPWNDASIFLVTTLGISFSQFFPYAIHTYFTILVESILIIFFYPRVKSFREKG